MRQTSCAARAVLAVLSVSSHSSYPPPCPDRYGYDQTAQEAPDTATATLSWNVSNAGGGDLLYVVGLRGERAPPHVR